MNVVLCRHCRKPLSDSRHILYGNDLDNPRKHEFEPLEEVAPKMKSPTDCFFEQVGTGGCGVCCVNTVLKMHGMSGVIFSYSMDKGTSPKRILRELRKAGLVAVSKIISVRNLKPKSILYCPPPSDHYVVVGEIEHGDALIYDSSKKEPYWLSLPFLCKKWAGWVIETRKDGESNGSNSCK
jgi:ABC-type bacteriocin/lantibiotic exporter with double-glycine peptidase domain